MWINRETIFLMIGSPSSGGSEGSAAYDLFLNYRITAAKCPGLLILRQKKKDR